MDLLICEGLRACSSVNCSHFVSHTFSMWICHRTSPAEVTHDYCIKTYLYPCKQIYRLKSWRHKFGVFVFWDQRVLSDKLCMCVCVCFHAVPSAHNALTFAVSSSLTSKGLQISHTLFTKSEAELVSFEKKGLLSTVTVLTRSWCLYSLSSHVTVIFV